MEIIKRKILLEDYINRSESNWGELTTTAYTMNVFFTQDVDDMGIGVDIPFIAKGVTPPVYTTLLTKLNLSNYTFEFMNNTTTQVAETPYFPNTRYPGKLIESYFINGERVTGMTEDRLEDVKSYDQISPYKVDFDITKGSYKDFKEIPFQGASKVLDNDLMSPITYMIDGDTSETINLNNPDPQNGIIYKTYSGLSRTINVTGIQLNVDGQIETGEGYGNYVIPITRFYYKNQGYNNTNSLLSASTKEEYLFGITSTPKVFSDLFIDRGRATILESHMQLGEITNMRELINYGNGYYKIQK